MQIPILNGIFTDEDSEFRTSYPRNLIPVPSPQGISSGYLRPADGIIDSGVTTPGISRGGINWDDLCYRVLGTKLVSVDINGVVSTIGDVGSGGQVSLDYSFGNLGVVSGGSFYLWDKTTFQQVTDPDLGTVIDHIFIDGYFMLTDGEFIIVTELTDPTSIDPLKYGSSEVDPDPIKALLKVRNEAHALNRYTIEVFDNIGGNGFPFSRIDGAQIQRGVIGTHACCVFLENIAFVGGGRNESPAVWLGYNGSSAKISSREIEIILQNYTEDQLSSVVLEPRADKGHQFLYLHLPDQTWVYDGVATTKVSEPVWFELGSTLLGSGQYLAKDFVWCYNKWLVGHPTESKIGHFNMTISSHWGDEIGWDFGTVIIYNEGKGALVHELELVSLPGRAILGDDPTISTRYSTDGETWSQWKFIKAGKQGQRNNRLVWLQQGPIDHWRIQEFHGTSKSHLSMARLEAELESLMV